MSAFGLEERIATLARIKTVNAGRAWQGSVLDDYEVPRFPDGKPYPYTVVDFGSPVRSMRDRNLAYGEKYQPHVLPVSVTCIAGDYEKAQALAATIHDLLLDWAPSDSADPFESKGGYGTRRPSTENVPTRYLEGLFFETTVNHGIPD